MHRREVLVLLLGVQHVPDVHAKLQERIFQPAPRPEAEHGSECRRNGRIRLPVRVVAVARRQQELAHLPCFDLHAERLVDLALDLRVKHRGSSLL